MPTAPPPPQFPPASGYPQMPAPAPLPSASLPQGPPLATMPAKAAGPPWTMILILNGLFILAVLLVLYFALRH